MTDTTAPDPTLLTPQEAAARAAAGALLVDVRRPVSREEFGVIPDATPVDRSDVANEFAVDVSGSLPALRSKDQEIVLFCSSEKGSIPGVEELVGLGFTRVRHILGGYTAWKEAGLPTTAPS